MPSYEELKNELETISKIVDKFPEVVKTQVFDLLVKSFLGQQTQPSPLSQASTSDDIASKSTIAKITGKKQKAVESIEVTTPSDKPAAKRVVSKESYQIDRDLNLRGDSSIPSFKAFVTEKQPSSAKEFNTVAVYYLQKMIGHTNVNLNHIYTCYTEVNRRPPKAFRQSFIDTKNKEGWIEFNSEGNLHVPHRGAVFVEHDLPPLQKKTSN